MSERVREDYEKRGILKNYHFLADNQLPSIPGVFSVPCQATLIGEGVEPILWRNGALFWGIVAAIQVKRSPS